MSSATDMSLMDLLFDREDPVLKNGFKEEIMLDADYNDPLTVSIIFYFYLNLIINLF